MYIESSADVTSSLWKFQELLDLRWKSSIVGNTDGLFMKSSIGLFSPVMAKGLLLME